jgi:hypothetical protein
LLCVLPDRNVELSEVENRMLSSGYTPTILLRKMIQRDVNITLPKFNIQFDMEMSPTLQKVISIVLFQLYLPNYLQFELFCVCWYNSIQLLQMGIRNLFTNEADLSGMSSSSRSATLKVSSVYHQCTIEVNEGGSEASAASGKCHLNNLLCFVIKNCVKILLGLEITPLSGGFGNHFGPIEFRADRPFLIYLIDRENYNIPLIIGRVYNPLQGKYTNVNQHQDSVEKTAVKAERHSPAKVSAALIQRTEFQPTRPFPQFIQESDQVIYPQKPSYYYNSVKQFANRYFSHSPPVKHLHTTPVVFPEDNFDGHHWKREIGNSTSLPEVSSTTVTSSTLENEDVDTRLKDPLWFNKPTAPEVIIPLNPPVSNHRPAIVRPQSTSIPEKPSSTSGQPFSSTIPPNIFFALPTAPNPSPVFPINQANNGWNQKEQNIDTLHQTITT